MWKIISRGQFKTMSFDMVTGLPGQKGNRTVYGGCPLPCLGNGQALSMLLSGMLWEIAFLGGSDDNKRMVALFHFFFFFFLKPVLFVTFFLGKMKAGNSLIDSLLHFIYIFNLFGEIHWWKKIERGHRKTWWCWEWSSQMDEEPRAWFMDGQGG